MLEPKTSFVQERARILSQQSVSTRYFLLRLHAPEIAKRAQPGQFVMLSCVPEQSSSCDPLLPRPLALLDANTAEGSISLLYFVAGRGTHLLNDLATHATAGQQRISILGPMGVGFCPVPDVDAHLGVGGGSGVAPLVFFLSKMKAAVDTPRHLILAARTKDQLPNREAVSSPGMILHEATDDGSAGLKGNAVDAMKELLAGPLKDTRVAVYAAGPEPMMLGAAQAARQLKVPCRVSLEERMACGIGVCRACVVDGTTPHPKTGLKRRTVCKDGPVFDPNDLAGKWSAPL